MSIHFGQKINVSKFSLGNKNNKIMCTRDLVNRSQERLVTLFNISKYILKSILVTGMQSSFLGLLGGEH